MEYAEKSFKVKLGFERVSQLKDRANITAFTYTYQEPEPGIHHMVYTPHLNGKKLSTNSPWDFEHVFETMDDY